MLLSGSVNRTVGPTYVLIEEVAVALTSKAAGCPKGASPIDFDPQQAEGNLGTMRATAQLPTLEHSVIA